MHRKNGTTNNKLVLLTKMNSLQTRYNGREITNCFNQIFEYCITIPGFIKNVVFLLEICYAIAAIVDCNTVYDAENLINVIQNFHRSATACF